jgi:hypothetical protein
VIQKVPTCVVEEPEDWMGEYPDTPSQPFQMREFRTGQLVGVMASSNRDLQILAQQHFAVRDPVIAMDGAALIGSDGYLMSLRRDAVVVAVPRHEPLKGGQQHPPVEQTYWIVERVDLRGINQFPPHGDVHLSHGQCTFHGNTTLPRKPDLGVNQIQKVIGTG